MRWFIPDGSKRPAHIPTGGNSVRHGCNGADGIVVGGIYEAGDWVAMPGGWYILHDNDDPACLLRLHTIDSVPVEIDGRTWLCPRLLEPSAGGWVSAIPRTYGPNGWEDPNELAPLHHRLRAALTQAKAGKHTDDHTLATLAADILACNYYTCLHELGHTGWLTERLAVALMARAATPINSSENVEH
jgi:hypothetical protein